MNARFDKDVKHAVTGSLSGNPFLVSIEKKVLENLQNEQFGVGDLARELNLSRYQIYRKLHSLTGRSISQYIREIRLNKAMELLKEGSLTASEISYQVGFSSPAYFNKCFTDLFGNTPGEIRKIEFPDSIAKSASQDTNNSAKITQPYIFNKSGPKRRRISKYLYTALGISVVILLIFLILIFFRGEIIESSKTTALPVNLPEKSIAVLQFNNLSGEEENLYFAQGIKEAIINHLSGLRDLRLSSRTATDQYRNSNQSILEIGKELEVTYILEGSVQKEENQIRTSIQIVDILHDRIILSRQYTVPLQGLFDLTTRIARDVTSELQILLTPTEEAILVSHTTTDLNAYDMYMRGRMYYANYFSMYKKEVLSRAENLYKKAIAIDPHFALAFVGLGEISKERRALFVIPSKFLSEYTDSIRIYTSKAIELDPNLADAYALRGLYDQYTNQIDRAIQDQEHAISLNPNLSESYFNLGLLWLNYKADPIKGLRYFKLAQFYERNGTLLPQIYNKLGNLYLGLDDFRKAEHYFRQTIQLVPGNPYVCGPISWMYCVQGKFEKALANIDSVCSDQSGSEWWCTGHYEMINAFMRNYKTSLEFYEQTKKYPSDVVVETDTLVDVNLGYIFLKTGRIREGKKILNNILLYARSFKDISHWHLAEIYAALGENKNAIEELRKQEKQNPYDNVFTFLPHYHVFEGLYEDPEVIKILDRVRLKKADMRKKIRILEEK